MIKEFREFINRGNVIDLAVAVVIGAAFGRIVTSLVDGILMPPLGLVLGRVDFSSLFVVLDSSKGVPASLADAKTQGVPVIAYGAFLNDIVNFVIVAFAVFLLVKQANRLKAPPPARDDKDVPFLPVRHGADQGDPVRELLRGSPRLVTETVNSGERELSRRSLQKRGLPRPSVLQQNPAGYSPVGLTLPGVRSRNRRR